MTVKQKTSAIVVGTLVLAVAILSFLSITSAKRSLLESRLNQLESIEKSKASHINDSFQKEYIDQVNYYVPNSPTKKRY